MGFVDKLLDKKNNDYSWTPRYGDMKQLKKALLYKRIVKWNENELHLEDGTIVTLETSEQDCCARAYGAFKEVELDAVITDIKITEMKNIRENEDDWDREITNAVEVFIFHNQNTIAKANMEADDGNGGYYYSVGSIVIDNVHFPIVEA